MPNESAKPPPRLDHRVEGKKDSSARPIPVKRSKQIPSRRAAVLAAQAVRLAPRGPLDIHNTRTQPLRFGRRREILAPFPRISLRRRNWHAMATFNLARPAPSAPPLSLVPGSGWTHRRVLVLGLGRHGGGLGVTRWLVSQGANVIVSDLRPAADLHDSLRPLRELPVELRLGGHDREDIHRADMVVVNPAIPPGSPWMREIEAAAVPWTTEIELFLAACPASVVGVTGTVGKSTVAALLHRMLRCAGHRCWLGGNFGGSLLNRVGHIGRNSVVVLELSSFQLARLSDRPRFHGAVVTNCSANHLDWHGTWEDYMAAKQRILALQDRRGWTVLNPADPEVACWSRLVRGRPAAVLSSDAFAAAGSPMHQQQNAALAAAAARCLGCDDTAMAAALHGFVPLPHRLQFVAEIAGRRFVNDSKATSPAATQAALSSLAGDGVWLVAGGHDKGVDLEPLVAAAVRFARGAAFLAPASARLATLAQRAVIAGQPAETDFRWTAADSLRNAVRWAWRQSKPGETILLSPGCASVAADTASRQPSAERFRDYADRGRAFLRAVAELAALSRE